MKRFLIPFAAGLLLLVFAVAAPLPDHQPQGASRPLETGDRFTLLAAQVHEEPDFASPSRFIEAGRRAELLAVRAGFYQLRLEATAEQPAESLWIWRSELGLRDLAEPVTKAPPLRRTGLASERPPRPVAAGDTLELASPVLYELPDLLGAHRIYSGRQRLRVLAPETAAGFLQLGPLDDDGPTGWLYRGELPEERRRTLPIAR
jgi:hypothetical protein